MKKLYPLICTAVMFLAYTGTQAQVLVVEDFEDPNAVNITDFSGWNTGLPPFSATTTNPCEGKQSASSAEFSNANHLGELYYISQQTTGKDVKISFDYKIQDKATGNPVSGKFGKIYLEYTTKGKTTPKTTIPWIKYDSITKAPVSTACTTHTYTIKAANLPSGSDFGWRLRVVGNKAFLKNNAYFVYVDDFKAVEQVDCIQPVNAGIVPGSITFKGAKITWEDLNATTPGKWQVVYCNKGNTPFPPPGSPFCHPRDTNDDLDPIEVTKPEVVLNKLKEGSLYDVYIRSLCGGGNGNSKWTGPIQFQTTAIGSTCIVPIEVNKDPLKPNVNKDLPYNTDDKTLTYADDEAPLEGAPGIGCGGASVSFDGYEVVYHYISEVDNILSIEVTKLTGTHVGVFVYRSCADIGKECIAGKAATTTNGSNLKINNVIVKAGEDIYVVIASIDQQGQPANTDYHLKIAGFNCNSWTTPVAYANPASFVAGQNLADFSGTEHGINPTTVNSSLTWYRDNAGSQGTQLSSPLTSILLADQDCYWVTQNLGNCESPTLRICFDEFDCNTLGGITGTAGDEVCESGSMTLKATAGTKSTICWYDSKTDGNLMGIGSDFKTLNLTKTTSYWATEVFIGKGLIQNQGNIGPVSLNSSNLNDTGLVFKATEAFSIIDVEVFSTGSGNLTVELWDADDLLKKKSIPVTGSITSPASNIIKLNWKVSKPGTYFLRKISGPDLLYEPDAFVNFPYFLGISGEVIGGTINGNRTGDYYYFFNWTISGSQILCEATPRLKVDAVVHPIAPTKVTADDKELCIGETTGLHVSSTDSNYNYTWTASDGSPDKKGADIKVTLTENTTYTVTATNPTTGCEYVNEISISVKNPSNLSLVADKELCLGETLPLRAGKIIYDFETGSTGWTTINKSTGPANPDAAEWKVVDSPYLSSGISSNDNSRFYISIADSIGPLGGLDSQLISPPISLVGVENATLSFYHHLKLAHIQVFPTESSVDISVNKGPWQTLVLYELFGIDDIGSPDNFIKEILDISDYTGSTIRIRFNYTGEWGWYWAVDNVIIDKNFKEGPVSWSPTTNLYYDTGVNVPYTGGTTNLVYLNASQPGSYTYIATLNVEGCPVTEKLTFIVHKATPPTGLAQQDFTAGEILADLEVSGQDLKWYIRDADGNLVRISPNTPLVDGVTYYVTQTIGDCESEPLAIQVNLNCPSPSNLRYSLFMEKSTAEIMVSWTPPNPIIGVVEYLIVITDMTSPNKPKLVYKDNLPLNKSFDIIEGLPLDRDFLLELYSVCDPANKGYSKVLSEEFNTRDLAVQNKIFENLAYYPNPTRGMVYIENTFPIGEISVYDLNGKRLFKSNPHNIRAQMDFSSLASGIYFVAIQVEKSTKMIKIIRE